MFFWGAWSEERTVWARICLRCSRQGSAGLRLMTSETSLIICVWSPNDCPSLSAIMARRRTGVRRKACGSFFTRPDYIIIKCEENARNFSVERNGKHDISQSAKSKCLSSIYFLYESSQLMLPVSGCCSVGRARLRQNKDSRARPRRSLSELCQHFAISGKSHVSNWY